VGPPCCHLVMNARKNYTSPEAFFTHTFPSRAKNGAEWEEAYAEADSVLGPKLSHWRIKAKTGEMDLVAGTRYRKACENAQALRKCLKLV